MKRKEPRPPRRESPDRSSAVAGAALPQFPRLFTLALLTLLVAAATILVHRPVLSARAESFDDEEAIVRNRLVQNPSIESVQRFFSEVLLSSVVRGYYRPLTLTSLMLDWAMGARPHEPYVFRRTSLGLHVVSTVLLILLCYQVFGKPWIAAAAGLIFGLHPLTVEPIAWIMERKTLLAALFAFAALNAYVRFARTNARTWYVTAILMFLCALLSKPTATPLPLMMLLMDYWPLKRFSRRAIVEKLPFFALSVLFAVLACVCEQRVNPLTIPAKLSALHLPLRLCWLTVFYPCKVFLPINLSSVYMLPDPLSLANPVVVAAAAGAVLLGCGVAWSARRTPAIWVGTTMFYLGLAPTMGFVGYSWVSASDKYAYLPAVGLVLILGWAIERLTTTADPATRRARQTVVASVLLLAAILLSVGTRYYLEQWQTTHGFFSYMIRLAPRSHYLHCQMGAYHLSREKHDQAIREYDIALSLRDTNPDAINNRGSVPRQAAIQGGIGGLFASNRDQAARFRPPLQPGQNTNRNGRSRGGDTRLRRGDTAQPGIRFRLQQSRRHVLDIGPPRRSVARPQQGHRTRSGLCRPVQQPGG